jgi:hypothetical protein
MTRFRVIPSSQTTHPPDRREFRVRRREAGRRGRHSCTQAPNGGAGSPLGRQGEGIWQTRDNRVLVPCPLPPVTHDRRPQATSPLSGMPWLAGHILAVSRNHRLSSSSHYRTDLETGKSATDTPGKRGQFSEERFGRITEGDPPGNGLSADMYSMYHGGGAMALKQPVIDPGSAPVRGAHRWLVVIAHSKDESPL